MSGIENYPGFISDFVRGTTKDFVISISKNGQPVDITGSKFYISFAYDLDPTTPPELVVTIDPPTDPQNGRTVGKITGQQTWSLNDGVVFYSVRWITAAGDPYVIDMGKIKVGKPVSDQLT